MGSMYMSGDILKNDLISTGYKKFWFVEPKGKKTLSSYIRQRSKSCGPASRDRRKAEFGDSGMVAVDAKLADDSLVRADDSRIRSDESRLRSDDYRLRSDDRLRTDEAEMSRLTNGSVSWNENIVERQSSGDNRGFARLDLQTLQNIGWVSGANEEKRPSSPASCKEAEELYRLTKVEFRKLQEQVQDVSLNLKNRFRASAYQVLSTKKKKKSKLSLNAKS